MRTVALISGGKDSCYNMMQCISEGHEVVALANLRPKDKDELDSYMYQTVGHHAIDLYAEAVGLPLYRHTIEGSSSVVDRDYNPTPGDEVEDLYVLLKKIKEELQIEAVSVGAILSDYQRVRVENVCQRLGLTALAFLWRQDQSELLKEMIDSGISAMLIKVASMGLKPKTHLGRTIKELYPQFLKMNTEFQLNVCGEGGEYETFTTDCPIFNKSIVIDESEEILHSDDAFAPVGYLNLKAAHLEDKNIDSCQTLRTRLEEMPMKRSFDILEEMFSKEEISSLEDDTESESLGHNFKTDSCAECTRLRIKQTEDDLWISGVTVENVKGQTIEQQTKNAMDKLKECIQSIEGGWELSNLCMINLYVRDLNDFVAINSVYKTYFGLNPPARVCVQVPLPENISLQLDCYGNSCYENRYTMHVQSISHWAPANIGPYSQAVKVNGRIYVAGQIAMVPSTLQIISGGVKAEARLSLRHVQRILQAMPGSTNLQNISMAICYVTNSSFIPTVKEEWKYSRVKFQTENELPGTSTSLLEFVVVPRLPRNAKVEWQVYSNVNSDYKIETFICRGIGLEAIGRYLLQDKSLSTVISVDASFNSSTTKNTKEVVESFCKCYSGVVSKSGVEWSSLPTLRIFYPVSFCSYIELKKELEEQMKEEVIWTIIPVLSLSTSSMLLLGCH